jgi:hypothetical protein
LSRFGIESKAAELALQKKKIVAESKEVNTGCNLAEFEGRLCLKMGLFVNDYDAYKKT